LSLDYYLGLLQDESRIEGFRRGIEEAVLEGDRVLDLGSGLGTFAFFAARAGADRVWAVDQDPIIHVARAVARENGLHDRIEFVRGRVPEVAIPEDPDVLIFEDFSRRFLDDRVFRLLLTFEETLLARGGRIVPGGARLCLAPADLEAVRDGEGRGPDSEDGPGSGNRPEPQPRSGLRFGIDWSAARPYWANEPRSGFVPPECLLGTAVTGPSLPLLPVPRASSLRIRGEWRMERPTRVDTLVHWFDLEPAPGLWVTNEPRADTGPWGQMLLPLDPSLELDAGEVLEVEVRREAFSDEAPGWLAWRAGVAGSDRQARGHEFAGFPAELADLYPGRESVDPDPSNGADLN